MPIRLTITKIYHPGDHAGIDELLRDLGPRVTPAEIAEKIEHLFMSQDDRITTAELVDATWTVEIIPDTARSN